MRPSAFDLVWAFVAGVLVGGSAGVLTGTMLAAA